MKEIDFIPEWYKADRVRKQKYVRQYTLIAVLFAVMMIWSFIFGHQIEHASAEVQELQSAIAEGEMRVQQAQELEHEISAMEEQTGLLDKITARTKMTAILGELSYLVQDNIILSELTLTHEPIKEIEESTRTPAAVVRIGNTMQQRDVVIPHAALRQKVTLTGIAAKPADAAALITRLEQTEYFEQVMLVYSKPRKIKSKDVTEFEIRCFVADYQIEE